MGKMNDLPKEIVFDILSRLPTESALDSKLVCKPWRDLVRLPSFGQKHLDRLNDSTCGDDSGDKVRFIYLLKSLQQPELIFTEEHHWRMELYYVECEEENHTEITLTRKTRMNLIPAYQIDQFVGSCNGIICFNYDYRPLYVCNPITREYVVLPDMVEEIYYWTGFGYSPSTNKYKVVRIRQNSLSSGVAQVYTLGGGNGWRNVGKVGMNCEKMKSIGPSVGALANGALHWVKDDNGAILAFNLIDEKLNQLPSPPIARAAGLDFSIDLGVLGGFLSAVYHPDYNRSEIWMWKKNEHNSNWSWSKQFSFGSRVEPSFELTKSGMHLYCGLGDIYSYDPKDLSEKMCMDLGMVVTGAIPHRNTLVSLEALGEAGAKTLEVGERAT